MHKFTIMQKSTGVEVTAEVPIGDTIKEAVELWGESVIYQKYLAGVTPAIKSRMDGMLNHDDPTKQVSDKDTIERMKSHKITKGRQRKSDLEKATELLADFSPEDRAKLLAQLQGEQGELDVAAG